MKTIHSIASLFPIFNFSDFQYATFSEEKLKQIKHVGISGDLLADINREYPTFRKQLCKLVGLNGAKWDEYAISGHLIPEKYVQKLVIFTGFLLFGTHNHKSSTDFDNWLNEKNSLLDYRTPFDLLLSENESILQLFILLHKDHGHVGT